MDLKNTYKLEKNIKYDTATVLEDGSPIPYLVTLPPDLTRISTEFNEILIQFVSSIINKYRVNSLLRYSDSILGIFNGLSHENIIDLTEDNADRLKFETSKLVLVDLSNRTCESSRTKYNDLVYIKENLNKNDLVLVSSGREFCATDNITILECIELIDLHKVAVIGFQDVISGVALCPQLRSASSFPEIDPYDREIHFYLISIDKPEQEFVAHASILNFGSQILENFRRGQSSDSITTGIYLPLGTYKGPIAWRAREEFLREEPNFKHWKKLELKSVINSHEVKQIRANEKITYTENKRYLEVVKLSSNADLYKLSFNRLPQNLAPKNGAVGIKYYLPVEFDLNIVLPDFVELFFQTPIAKNICKIVSLQPYFSVVELDELWIYAPSIDEQKKIIQLIENHKKVYKNIKELQVDLVMNPGATNHALEKVNSILSLFDQLDNYSRVNQLIREGESMILEFKQTFSLDIKTGTKEDWIETSAIKTIAGFLNSKGGKLLIGVSDDGQITGLNQEISKFFKTIDKLMLHVKNKIKSRIGEDNYPFIDVNLIKIEESLVLEITCKQSTDPVFVDGNDFYVRTNPATDKLEGPKLLTYIKRRFSN
jgi:hypothetical protein